MSNILDPLLGAIFFIVFGIALIVSLTIFNALPASLLGSYATSLGNFYVSMNNVAIFILIGMAMGAVFAALLIRTHPAFFIIAVVMVFLEFMIVPNLVNAFNVVAQQSSMATASASMGNLVNLIQYLPITTAIFTFLAAIVGLMRE